jgi:ribosomal protein S27E
MRQPRPDRQDSQPGPGGPDHGRQKHVEPAAFFARAEAGGARVPGFVRAEFDATLVCGRPEHGIVRLRCASCGHDEILAFSCKRRGFCPACGTRLHAPRAAGGAWRRVPRIWWSGSFPPYRCASSC